MYSTVLEFLNILWGAMNQIGMKLTYRPARLHRLAELIPWNRFLGSLKFGLSTIIPRLLDVRFVFPLTRILDNRVCRAFKKSSRKISKDLNSHIGVILFE
jgi:hypothetical protein